MVKRLAFCLAICIVAALSLSARYPPSLPAIYIGCANVDTCSRQHACCSRPCCDSDSSTRDAQHARGPAAAATQPATTLHPGGSRSRSHSQFSGPSDGHSQPSSNGQPSQERRPGLEQPGHALLPAGLLTL